MTTLITGAAGFIGSHLVKHLRDEDEKVVSVIHDYVPWTKWLEQSIKPTIRVRGDIRNTTFLKRVINKYEVTQVFHLAAQSIVARAWKDPLNTFDINIMGTAKLLEVCRQLEIEKILIQSTDKVFGNVMHAHETSRLIPTEPYGSSKIAADIIAQTYVQTYGMNISITRCCNIYGYDWNNRIIPNTILSCLNNKAPIIYKNDQSMRQYMHISDATHMLVIAMEEKGIYNLATEEKARNQEEVVLEILKYFPRLKPKYVEKSSLKQIESQSMKPSFLFKPPSFVSFSQGIKQTIEAFKKWT